ncbi:serine/threonine-protein phosphatase 7 long form-like protein [Senna tora]|uniref:Serine/threonine-protein phosphatase 7 long form-like protein n=1 Tax=Senna tora TaxID=362788 RepID=A0A834SWH0_9FABA|nr:serine/threonine-protein phosphatase 7 long form-like protein [Senna tora]
MESKAKGYSSSVWKLGKLIQIASQVIGSRFTVCTWYHSEVSPSLILCLAAFINFCTCEEVATRDSHLSHYTGRVHYYSRGCDDTVRYYPTTKKLTGQRLSLAWLAENFTDLADDANDAQVQQFDRAYILRLIGGIIWRPYAANEIRNLIPGYCLAGREVWLAEDRHIKSTTTKIKDDNVSLLAEPFFLVKTIRKRSCSRLVDYSHNVEATKSTSLFGGSTLRVVEERWYSDNCILHG